MEQRLTLVTLGVDDVAEARRFFEEGLGWRAAAVDSDEVAFFDCGTCALALFGRGSLAHDATVTDDGGRFVPVSIAWNGRSRAEVDAAFAKAVAAGGDPVKAPEEVFWGGYSGYVRIPGGHLLELAHNPDWSLDETGRMELPEPASCAPHKKP